MIELVFGTRDLKVFEILEFTSSGDWVDKYRNKCINSAELIELLNSLNEHVEVKETEIFNINKFEAFKDNLVMHKRTNLQDIVVVDFKEQYIRTFYNNKYYKVLHCNAFIKLCIKNNKVDEMYIYPYKEDMGLETELYDNPFPNIYTGNRTCIGTADRTLKDSYFKTILGILETSYTHMNMKFKSGKLKETAVAFEYLGSNPFPYEDMMKTTKKLKDIL